MRKKGVIGRKPVSAGSSHKPKTVSEIAQVEALQILEQRTALSRAVGLDSIIQREVQLIKTALGEKKGERYLEKLSGGQIFVTEISGESMSFVGKKGATFVVLPDNFLEVREIEKLGRKMYAHNFITWSDFVQLLAEIRKKAMLSSH